MSIQWFPGHMNAARKKAAESMEKVDLVIEVLDGRVPQASSNPMIEALRLARQRPCLKLLNKSDLSDPEATRAWIAHYAKQPQVHAVAISCRKPADVAKIPALALKLAPHRGTNLKPLRVMIMGIPNVGKSTLMNALLKKRVAKVGDEPAVTKSQQRLYLGNNIVLIDTPGLMWPKIEHPTDGLMLWIIVAARSGASVWRHRSIGSRCWPVISHRRHWLSHKKFTLKMNWIKKTERTHHDAERNQF